MKVTLALILLEEIVKFLQFSINSKLTLIRLEPKMITVVIVPNIAPSLPPHPCSLIRLYTVGYPSSHLDISKNDDGELKKIEG